MEEKINSIKFLKSRNTNSSKRHCKRRNNPDTIKSLLVKQIFSKVRWRESMEFMGNSGINTFIEVGPGKVLTGLAKRIVKDKKIININEINNLELLKNEF